MHVIVLMGNENIFLKKIIVVSILPLLTNTKQVKIMIKNHDEVVSDCSHDSSH